MLTAINILVLSGWSAWRIRQGVKGELGRWFPLALLWKVAAGLALGWLYIHHYGGGDTTGYFADAARFAQALADHPADFRSLLFGPERGLPEDLQLTYSGQPRAIFFARFLALLYLMTGGSYWLSSVYLSLISFEGVFFLVRRLMRYYPEYGIASAAAFLVLPSFVFWSSGILKESLSTPALCVLAGLTLDRYHRPATGSPGWIFLGLPALLVLWWIRYFYAAVFVPLALALIAWAWARRRFRPGYAKALAAALAVVLAAGIFTLPGRLHYNLQWNVLPGLIYDNYRIIAAKSRPGAFLELPRLKPTPEGIAQALPEALWTGLFRPGLWDGAFHFPALFAVIENSLLLALILPAIGLAWKRKLVPPAPALAAGVFVLVLAATLPLVSPNFGSLARYKAAYLPFLWLMVLAACQPLLRRYRRRAGHAGA
jgi:hypothetical protein